MINKAILMGRLTRDPELRNTNSGASVCNFSIAIDDGYGDNRTTSFINCIAWNKTAEFVSNYFSKGKMIIVVGKIQSRSWDGQDGRKNYTTEVVVNEVSFGESKSGEGETSTTNLPNNATQVNSGDYHRNGSYTTGKQQRMDDMPEYDDGFKMISDEDDDLPF